jgi:hypothetical protein
MVRLTQQQLPSSAARDNGCMLLANVLRMVGPLLCCWAEIVDCKPALLQVVVRTLRPLVQQLQGCGSLLMWPAAAAAAASVQDGSSSSSSSSSSSGYEHNLQYHLFAAQQAASRLLAVICSQKQVDAGVAAELLRLHNDPAVVEMQLQLLTAWTAELHKQHTAQQQQRQLPPGTAGASTSSMQGQQQPVRHERRADLLSIPAFHQDMLQLLPGGQGYLDVAAETAARWGEDSAFQLRTYASNCCNTINRCLESHRESIAGQQQISRNPLVSSAAVRLVLELQLLASGAVQRQREQLRQQHQEQQQQQQMLTLEDQASTDKFALQTWEISKWQIKALVVSSRSCLPPEVLQQAGLQLLQALAAPLQLWQLSSPGDSFAATAVVTGMSPLFGDTLQGLVTAACGAEATQSQDMIGEQNQWSSGVCKSAF